MGFKNLYDAKLVAIHILGSSAAGDLKLLFKEASMFGRELFSFHTSSIFIHGLPK
jgi:hypothetical protein